MEKNKRLNNRGYMLVEIILASAIAFGIAYFIIDLTINLKNKNDDLLVTTLTATDQAIITNGLMEHINDEGFCNNLDISGNTITYGKGNKKETIVIVNEYAQVKVSNKKEDYCSGDQKSLVVNIPLNVPQLPNENFNVELHHPLSVGYTITFDPNGGKFVDKPNEDYITKKIMTGETYGPFPIVTKADEGSNSYTFRGWYPEEGGSKVEESDKFKLSYNQTLHAEWSIEKICNNSDPDNNIYKSWSECESYRTISDEVLPDCQECHYNETTGCYSIRTIFKCNSECDDLKAQCIADAKEACGNNWAGCYDCVDLTYVCK